MAMSAVTMGVDRREWSECEAGESSREGVAHSGGGHPLEEARDHQLRAVAHDAAERGGLVAVAAAMVYAASSWAGTASIAVSGPVASASSGAGCERRTWTRDDDGDRDQRGADQVGEVVAGVQRGRDGV